MYAMLLCKDGNGGLVMNKIFEKRKYHHFETSRLILDKLSNSDEKLIYNLYSDSKVMKFMQSKIMKNKKEAVKYINKMNKMFKSKKGIRWAVSLKKSKTKQKIGTFAIHYYDSKSKKAELGADLLVSYWNKGYVSELVSFFILNIFKNIDLNRIEIRCMPENKASMHIANKFGFKYEGTLREFVYIKGKGYTDEMVFSLLQKDLD
ncbi:MAG: GNAT family N-acetyltransferase [Candidatus Mcinerneyibacterium aminivorans]|uniref:GNAT family N-acetyltransferase n=1 Tax=Candidatus Mcinerneyibacterium aminivorans TaxID=2703815 RepID=A0A5D0MHX2_9BACT|nr:MAG: GNAT family N-acetyltransferase [Candidatus Mcinerneyibacterium aminivorans]